MDSNDAAELIAELHEDRADNARAERFRSRAALLIACLAAVLAVGGLGGGNATDDMIYNNVRASDTWAFYQAKNVRQTAYELRAAEIEAQLAAPGLDPAARARMAAQLADYRATVTRYESEPDQAAPNDPLRGEGKAQLRAQAQAFEAAREQASARDDNFDMAEVFLQLALVLGSVAILALNRMILGLATVLGALGTLLTANGFLLLFPLPF
ncbi:MAG: DUF4337 domain-containing protein [Alphaproteobacteria bacterium]|nr:MAG: DUF4337 domain-containing protein [Alphaproteobacteria bacterium]